MFINNARCKFYQINTSLGVTFSFAKTAITFVDGSFLVKSQTRLGVVLKMLGRALLVNTIIWYICFMFYYNAHYTITSIYLIDCSKCFTNMIKYVFLCQSGDKLIFWPMLTLQCADQPKVHGCVCNVGSYYVEGKWLYIL